MNCGVVIAVFYKGDNRDGDSGRQIERAGAAQATWGGNACRQSGLVVVAPREPQPAKESRAGPRSCKCGDRPSC